MKTLCVVWCSAAQTVTRTRIAQGLVKMPGWVKVLVLSVRFMCQGCARFVDELEHILYFSAFWVNSLGTLLESLKELPAKLS